jgi:hypothetical protein
MSLFKFPKCEGYGGYSEYPGDSYFECRYPRQNAYKYDNYIEDCNDCLCSWDTYGGRINPKTNRKWPFFLCFLLFGVPFRHRPRCGNCKYAQDKLHDDGRVETTRCPITNQCVGPDDWHGCRWFVGKQEKPAKEFDWAKFK